MDPIGSGNPPRIHFIRWRKVKELSFVKRFFWYPVFIGYSGFCRIFGIKSDVANPIIYKILNHWFFFLGQGGLSGHLIKTQDVQQISWQSADMLQNRIMEPTLEVFWFCKNTLSESE